MKNVFRVDQEGYFVEPVRIAEKEKAPIDCVDVTPPNGLYNPKWNGSAWEEGMPQSEIDAIKNAPVQKTEIDILKEQQELMQQALDEIIMGGGI